MDEELLQRIRTDPTVMVGKSAIRGTRIPVELILKLNDSTDSRGSKRGMDVHFRKGGQKVARCVRPKKRDEGLHEKLYCHC